MKFERKINNKAAVIICFLCGATLGFGMNITSGIITENPWVEKSAVIKGLILLLYIYVSLV
jgi:hypothetical protein